MCDLIQYDQLKSYLIAVDNPLIRVHDLFKQTTNKFLLDLTKNTSNLFKSLKIYHIFHKTRIITCL